MPNICQDSQDSPSQKEKASFQCAARRPLLVLVDSDTKGPEPLMVLGFGYHLSGVGLRHQGLRFRVRRFGASWSGSVGGLVLSGYRHETGTPEVRTQ